METQANEMSSEKSYSHRGYMDGKNCDNNLTQYRDIVLNNICPEHKRVGEKARQNKIESIESNIKIEEHSITERRQEIQKKEVEKNKFEVQYETNNVNPGIAHLIIPGFIMVILGIALFLFYGLTMSGVISALVKSNDQMQNNLLQAAIPTLWDTFLKLPAFLKTISILFSVLPLGIGTLLKDFKQKKQWILFLSILLFVLILDIVIATVIERQVYNQESLINELPPFKEYVKDSILGTFGAIILLGFGAYVIWGLMYDSFMEKLNPQIQKVTIEQKIKNLVSIIDNLKVENTTISNKIIEMKKEIGKLKDTTILVMDDEAQQELEKDLGDYTIGWSKYIDGRFHTQPNLVKTKVQELYDKKTETLNEFYTKVLIIKN